MEVISALSVSLLALSAVVFAGIFIKVYYKMTTGICRSTRRLDGKTAIVTGANTGIGKETARDLAHRGARVILACRDMKRAALAKDDIFSTTGNKQIICQQLDLSSLDSVRKFAQKIYENENRLDILINNAAGINLPNVLSDDGLQIEMQTNHFGPFLLTILLLGIMKKSAPSRIVMVSSFAHKFARLDLEKLHTTAPINSTIRYCNAKLANILFVRELASKLKGTGISINAAHPGIVRSEALRRITPTTKFIVESLIRTLFKNEKEGAQTSIHVAVSEEVNGVSGAYFMDCKEERPSKQAQDKTLAKKLWDLSVQCVKLREEEMLIFDKIK